MTKLLTWSWQQVHMARNNMVGAAVAMVICIMHDKPCICCTCKCNVRKLFFNLISHISRNRQGKLQHWSKFVFEISSITGVYFTQHRQMSKRTLGILESIHSSESPICLRQIIVLTPGWTRNGQFWNTDLYRQPWLLGYFSYGLSRYARSPFN